MRACVDPHDAPASTGSPARAPADATLTFPQTIVLRYTHLEPEPRRLWRRRHTLRRAWWA
jgi:hypothetical protein